MSDKRENKLPKRKHPRLDNYDYSTAGAYFITICTQNRKCVLSRIVGRGLAPAETGENVGQGHIGKNVGRGLAPAETGENVGQGHIGKNVGRGLAPAEMNEVEYTSLGKIAETQLRLLEERYPCLAIDQYVIMPNHIHAILILNGEAAGASPRPTIMDIVCTYKSLTMRECKKYGFSEKLFQTSFYEHVIRGREDYEGIVKYIYENPVRWYYDELYVEE